jgi:hypothetical protein
MLDEVFAIDEEQLDFVEETEKPYDKYLKLHNYDPKTNTIEIDGKRVNAGSRGSNKERNRMNKILRENDYDPKSGTYKSDIKVKDPKTGNVENQRVKLKFNPHEDIRSEASSNGVFGFGGLNFDKTNINMTPKGLGGKPKSSGHSLKHEEGHLKDNGDQDNWITRNNSSKEIKNIKKEARESNEKDFKDLKYSKNNPQMAHANKPEEKYADLYGELNNKHGFGATKQNMGHLKNEYKDRLSEEDKEYYAKELDETERIRDTPLEPSRAYLRGLMNTDGAYAQLLDEQDFAGRKLKKYKRRLNASPEERLKMKGYSSEDIEDLKKSGKLEDTLKEKHMDDEFLKRRAKEYDARYMVSSHDLKKREDELLNDEDFKKEAKDALSQVQDTMRARYDDYADEIHDRLDAKKNYDAEMDSRTNFVERKIRELAEKDPEVKRKLAEYDAAMARRKQKLEKRKANKAEAREKEARRAQEYTEYYLDDIEIAW